MPRWTLEKTVEFDAAHYLPKHPGRCKNLHGHRWKVTVVVGVDELDLNEMIIDFGHISAIIKQLDHTCLNDRFDFEPTAENLAFDIAEKVARKVDRTCDVAVTVQETPGSKVTCVL